MAATTKEKEEELTGQDLADILASALDILRDNGVRVGVKPVPQKEDRSAGLLVYVGGLNVSEDGRIIV